MKAFWDAIGKGLAKVAKVAGEGALWASQHPAVITTIASLAGHPEVGAVVARIAPVAEPIGAAIEAKIAGK